MGVVGCAGSGAPGEEAEGKLPATGGSRARLQAVPAAGYGARVQEGVREGREPLRLPFCVRPGRWVYSRGRGAGWVGADVPHVPRSAAATGGSETRGAGGPRRRKRGSPFWKGCSALVRTNYARLSGRQGGCESGWGGTFQEIQLPACTPLSRARALALRLRYRRLWP